MGDRSAVLGKSGAHRGNVADPAFPRPGRDRVLSPIQTTHRKKKAPERSTGALVTRRRQDMRAARLRS